jgi:hypothetical protein
VPLKRLVEVSREVCDEQEGGGGVRAVREGPQGFVGVCKAKGVQGFRGSVKYT